MNRKVMKNKLLPFYKQGIVEAGCDEAGRGCLAGPVVAAAVVLPENFDHPLLNDSKQLSEKQRDLLRPLIESQALAWAVGIVDNNEVDQINILNASFLAMHRAVDQLKITPQHLLIDGNRFKKYKNIEHLCVVKGDGKYMSIAAASVLAKTHRDSLMQQLHAQYPNYAWNKNKGYPTKDHRKAISIWGETQYHRKTFRLLPDAVSLKIDFNV
ncbi:MAG: ribonuclease HII [Prolixibacteraceae bacterium]|nr:ribonuclease HII [Prolixibacteraceae bacterium]